MTPVERTLAALVKRAKKRTAPPALPAIPSIPRRSAPKREATDLTPPSRPENWKALVRGRWPLYFEELWDERAAIMTFEGGLNKEEAEGQAYDDLVRRYEVLKGYEDELFSLERDPRVALLKRLVPVKLVCLEWKKENG